MTNESAPKLVMKLETGAPCYVFTLQARTGASEETQATNGSGRDVPADGSRYRAENEYPRPLDASVCDNASRPTDGENTDASGSSQFGSSAGALASGGSQPGAAPSPLTLAQIETARNAAVSVLNAIGIEVDSTSSVLEIDPQPEASRIVLTADIQPLSTIAQTSPENDGTNEETTPENESQEP